MCSIACAKCAPRISWSIQRASADQRTVDLVISQISSEAVKSCVSCHEFINSAWPVPILLWAKTVDGNIILRSRFYLSAQEMTIRVTAPESICSLGIDDGSDGFGHFIFASGCPPQPDPGRIGSVVSGFSRILGNRVSIAVRGLASKRLTEVLRLRAQSFVLGKTIDEEECDLIWNVCTRLHNSGTAAEIARGLQDAMIIGAQDDPVVGMVYRHARCLRKKCVCEVESFNDECHHHLMEVVGLPSSLPPDRRASFPPTHWLDQVVSVP